MILFHFFWLLRGYHYHLTLSNVVNKENFSTEITEELEGNYRIVLQTAEWSIQNWLKLQTKLHQNLGWDRSLTPTAFLSWKPCCISWLRTGRTFLTSLTVRFSIQWRTLTAEAGSRPFCQPRWISGGWGRWLRVGSMSDIIWSCWGWGYCRVG